MPLVEFSQLPENFRVKLSEKGKKDLWHRVDEFGGVKNLAEAFDYSRSKIYNWKSKDLALPVNFVRQIMGENNTDEIILLKGPGSSGKIKDPDFPLKISDEFLTRVEASVKENKEDTPIYITPEKDLVDRFAELIDEIGEVEYRIYSRDSRYELRYPKFLHQLFRPLDFETNTSALIDEKGEIKSGQILLDDRKISVDDFEGKLYSREKSFELALEKGDSQKIAELMAQENEKVKGLIDN